MKVISLFVGMLPLIHGLVITNPCCSEFAHRVSAFGPALPVKGLSSSRTLIEEIEASIALAGSELCSSTTDDLNNTIVVVPRGGCSFGDKVLNSQSAGAVAVVVYETDASESGVVTMSANPADSAAAAIPSVFVSGISGAAIVGILTNASGTAVGVLNATGSVSIMLQDYDFTFYTIVMLLGATAAFLLVVIITISGCCQSRHVSSRGTSSARHTVLAPGKYDAAHLSGGGAREMETKTKRNTPPPGKYSDNPRYKPTTIKATV